MLKVTIYLTNGDFYRNEVQYAFEEEICERLNACQSGLFINVADMIVRKDDIAAVALEQLPERTENENNGSNF